MAVCIGYTIINVYAVIVAISKNPTTTGFLGLRPVCELCTLSLPLKAPVSLLLTGLGERIA